MDRINKIKTKVSVMVKHPVFSGSAIMIGGSMGVNVMNYAYHLVMGRVLGPVDYGILASVFSLLYIISIVPLSTSVSIVKFVSSAKNKKEVDATYHGINSFTLKVALAALVILTILSIPIAGFLHIENTLSVFLVGPVLFFSLLALVNQATAQGLLKFTGVVVPNVISSVGKFVIGLLFVYLGFSVVGATFGVFLGMILAYLYSRTSVKSIVGFTKKEKFSIKPFLKFSLPALMQALAFTSFFTVDLLLVKHFLPPFEAGIYAAISTLGKIIYFAVTPIVGVMFPLVSKKVAGGEKHKGIFIVSFTATIAISLLIVGFYALFPNIAIGVLYGSKYLVASGNLIWMGIFMSFYTASYLLVNYFLSLGKTKIVILPLFFAVLQVVLITFVWHASIYEVIITSLGCMIALFIGLIILMIHEK